MKTILTFLFLALLTGGSAASEQRIAQVDFYPTSVKFSFEVKTDADGKFELELPATFSQISDWRTSQELRPGWVPDSLKALDSSVRAGKQKLSELDAKINSLNQTVKLLSTPQTKSANLDEVIDYVKEAQNLSEKALVEIANLTRERGELKSKTDLFEAAFNSKMPRNASNSLKAYGVGDKNSTVTVEAFSDTAWWVPRYKMKLDSKSGKIDAELFAAASQKTGLDFDGAVRFHTNMPRQHSNLPELRPKIVDILPPPPPQSANAKGLDMMMSAPAPAAYRASAPMPTAAPEMISGLAAVTISGKGKMSGDGSTEDISLGKFLVDSKVSLVSVPEYGGTVYIIAETEPLKQAIIAGNLQLHVDGQASSSSKVRSYGEGEKAKLTFGTAPLIKVERKEIVSKSDSSWWSSSGILNDGYTIEVTNGMSAEKEITLKDRIPISANSKIIVKNLKFSHAPAEKTDENIVTWKLSVKPGEKVKIEVNYTLEFPATEALMFR